MKYDPGQLNKLIPVYVVDVIDVEDYDDGIDVDFVLSPILATAHLLQGRPRWLQSLTSRWPSTLSAIKKLG